MSRGLGDVYKRQSKKWADEDTLTTDTDPPLSPEALLSRLRTEFKVDGELTDAEARKLVGLRYCLAVTKLNQLSTAAIASDISVELIAELKDPAIMETIKGMIPVPMQEMAPGQYALSPDANTTIYFGLNDNTFYATTDSDALVFLTGAQTSAYEAEVGKLFRGSYGTMFVDFPAVRSLIESLIAQNRLDQSAAASLMALSLFDTLEITGRTERQGELVLNMTDKDKNAAEVLYKTIEGFAQMFAATMF